MVVNVTRRREFVQSTPWSIAHYWGIATPTQRDELRSIILSSFPHMDPECDIIVSDPFEFGGSVMVTMISAENVYQVIIYDDDTIIGLIL